MASMTESAASSVRQRWTAVETRAQFGAIARLRWRLLINGFRRKGGVGDLVANIVIAPIALLFILGPAIGAAFLGYFAIANNRQSYLIGILWGIFALSQFANVQLGQPGTTFDPTQLIRFPLNFRGYAAIRLFFGLISPANVTTTFMSLGTAIGAFIASPESAGWIFLALGAYALANIFFTRMLFAWVDRWLSTRRTREIFTGVIFIGSLGFQWANVTFNPGFHHSTQDRAVAAARLAGAHNAYHHIQPLLEMLPPGLTAHAVLNIEQGSLGSSLMRVAGVLAFAAVFFAIFAMRLAKEFRGETLSEAASAVAAVARPVVVEGNNSASLQEYGRGEATASHLSAREAVAAIFSKELVTLRRNTGLFYGLIAPLVMLLIFAGKLAGHSAPGTLFGIGVAYTMLGIAPLSYNSFGMEGAGVQFYFLAPVSMRYVFLAKNLFNILLAVFEIGAVFAAISYIRRAPSPQMTISVLLWAAFTLLVSMSVGNRRSITAPKKVDPQKPAGKQASALSALLSMGVMLAAAAVGAGVYLLAMYFAQPWIVPVAAVVLAIAGCAVYLVSLSGLDKLLADHRETLIEQLCKAG